MLYCLRPPWPLQGLLPVQVRRSFLLRLQWWSSRGCMPRGFRQSRCQSRWRVKVANLSKFFPAWTVTREQWAAMMIPSISGVAIDMLLFSRIGSPLCHRYRLICRTGSHAAFRGTYLRRLRAFLDESDSAAYRQSGECATSIYSRTPDCFSVMTTASPKWSFKFGRGAGVNLSASGKNVFHAGIDGSRAP